MNIEPSAAPAAPESDRLRGEVLTLQETIRAVSLQRNAALDACAKRDADVAVRDMALGHLGQQFNELKAQMDALRAEVLAFKAPAESAESTTH